MHVVKNISLGIIVSLFVACGKAPVTEGKIVYSIEYPAIDKEKKTFTYMMLPKKQSFTFNQDHIKVKVKKAMFDLNLLMGVDKSYFYSELSFDGDKYVDLSGKVTEELKSYIPTYSIAYTNEQDTLLGFTIKKAIASHPEIGEAEVWYTEDIQIPNPNWYSPYRDLSGVLMKYTVNQFGLIMQFEASKFEHISKDSIFYDRKRKGMQIELSVFQDELDQLFKGVLE
jgi:hypothetical protein